MSRKIICFPFHPPYQTRMMKGFKNDKFFIVDGFNGVHWENSENPAVGSSARQLPNNAVLIDYSELMLNYKEYDYLMLQTPEHIRWLSYLRGSGVKIIYGWNQIFPIPLDVKQLIIGENGIAISTSSFNNVRPQDSYIIEGHEPSEFKRSHRTHKAGAHYNEMVVSVNRFASIGKTQPDITGYNMRDVFRHMNVRLYGTNPEFEYGKKSMVEYGVYKHQLPKYIGGFQPSPFKHRSFSSADMMLSGLPVIFMREKTPFYYDGMESKIVHGENGYIARDKYEVLVLYKDHIENHRWNSDKTFEVGENARQTIIDEFPMKQMTEQWQEHFNKMEASY